MPKKKIKKDKKMTVQHHKRVQGIPIIKHDHPQPGITKKEFIDILEKASQPVVKESHETR